MANEKIITLDNLAAFKDKCDETYAVPDGNYPTMTVGAADSLTPYGENSGANDTTPFVFQSSGGSSDVGSKAYLRELRGNTVAFNQPVQNGNFASVSVWGGGNRTYTVLNNVATITPSAIHSAFSQTLPNVVGHKYLYAYDIKYTNGEKYTFNLFGVQTYNIVGTGNWKHETGIITSTNSNNIINFYDYDENIRSSYQLKNVNVFDLTLMFGAGNEPTSVLEFNRLFPKPYYSYNVGTLLSSKVNGIKNVGYNAFDGQLEQGRWDGDGTDRTEDTTSIRSKNFIKVVAGQKYTLDVSELGLSTISGLFIMECPTNSIGTSGSAVRLNQSGSSTTFTATLSNNTQYVRFYVKYASNVSVPTNPKIAFHLTWDGSRTGYEPHEEWQYALPNIELRSAGSVNDVAYSTGGGKRRVGVVDLGTLNWNYYNGKFYAGVSGIAQKAYGSSSNLLTPRYRTVNAGASGDGQNGDIWKEAGSGTVIYIYDSSYTDAATFKTAMSGVYLYYELATETDIITEENQGWQNPQDIDDFGTQEFLYDNDITIPVPQGNEFFYPVDYKAFIDSLGGREDIEYAADQIVSQEQLQTALSTFLSSISGYDATKTQTLKNVSGVFQWVDD